MKALFPLPQYPATAVSFHVLTQSNKAGMIFSFTLSAMLSTPIESSPRLCPRSLKLNLIVPKIHFRTNPHHTRSPLCSTDFDAVNHSECVTAHLPLCLLVEHCQLLGKDELTLPEEFMYA